MTSVFDTVFVGGGIACLYAALRHKQLHSNAKFVILEQAARIGGRVAWTRFAGLEVLRGAGVGRLHHPADQLLLRLLVDLGIPHDVSARAVRYYETDATAVPMGLMRLQRARRRIVAGDSFRDFAMRVLGAPAYHDFLVSSGFRDFEGLDAAVALEHYHFEDTHGMQTAFTFSWHHLVRRLAERLRGHIRMNTTVTAVETIPGGVRVSTACGHVFSAKQVCVGVTVNSLRRLFPRARAYRSIASQPFMRIYALLNQPLPVDGYTVVHGVLQKIVSMPRANVYMIAYSDNRNAVLLQGHTRHDLEVELQVLFRDPAIRILRFLKCYWEEGTHLYRPGQLTHPLRELVYAAQHPARNVFVVGEAVALNQGWVGPALESTTRVALR